MRYGRLITSDPNELETPAVGETIFRSTVDNLLYSINDQGIILPLSVAQGFLVYEAIINQSGTDAPVSTVFQNTLGGDPVWNYLGIGTYELVLADAFTVDKTLIYMGGGEEDQGGGGITWSMNEPDQPDKITLLVNDASGSADNGLLANTAMLIKVYP